MNIYFLDRKYVVLSEKELMLKLSHYAVNKNEYIPEEFDCDDFTIRLMDDLHEYAFGMVLLKLKNGTMHSVNV
jgi:hypothetical protein